MTRPRIELAKSADRPPRRRPPTDEWMVEDPTVADEVIPFDVLVTLPQPGRGEP